MSINADEAAKHILNGVLRDRKYIYAPFSVFTAYLLSVLLPKQCNDVIISGAMSLTTKTDVSTIRVEDKKND